MQKVTRMQKPVQLRIVGRAGEHHECGDDQHLVCDRIHQLAEIGHDVMLSRISAIENIRDRSGKEDHCGDPMAVRRKRRPEIREEQSQNEQRNQKDPQDCQLVCKIHKHSPIIS